MYQTMFFTSSPTEGFSRRTSSVCQSVAISSRMPWAASSFSGAVSWQRS
jgi:hypothetical protein